MSLMNNPLIECKNDVVRLVADNELFLHQNKRAQEQFAHYMGEKIVPQKNIHNFNTNIKRNLSYSTDKNIKYCHVVFPAKPIVYKEKLSELGVSVNSLFTDYYNKTKVIYPLNCLYDDSCMEKYGTHYSGKGYCNVAMCMLESIGESFEGTPVYSTKKIKKSGLAKMYDGNLPACEQLVFESFENLPAAIITLSNSEALAGNSGKIIFKYNPLAPRKKRVLLFGDSFFVGLLNIISSLYEEVIFLRSAYVLEDVANALSPDIIFTGNAERYLVNTPSCLSGSPFFLNFISSLYSPENLSSCFVDVITFLLRNEKEKYLRWKKKVFIAFLKDKGSKGILKDGLSCELSTVHLSDVKQIARLAYDAKLYQFTIDTITKLEVKVDDDYFLLAKSFNRISCFDSSLDAMSNIKVKKYSHLEFLGDLYFQNGDFALAIDFYNNAISLNSKLCNSYLKLGRLYGFLGDYSKEKENYLLAYEREPDRKVTRKMVGRYT